MLAEKYLGSNALKAALCATGGAANIRTSSNNNNKAHVRGLQCEAQKSAKNRRSQYQTTTTMEDLLKQYNQTIVDTVELKRKVRKRLEKYETSLKEAKKPSREEQSDGWITVRHKSGRDATKKHSKGKKRRKVEKLVNFYAFEVKESKLKKHKELLEKFEEDKRRLAKMREQRKFKL